MEGVKFVFPIIRYIIILFTNFSLFFNLSRFQKKNHKRIIVEDCLTKMLETELQGWAHGVGEAAHDASPCYPHVHSSQKVAHDAIPTAHGVATRVYMPCFLSNSRERERKIRF
jgi:hypothetical protein